MFIQYWDWVVTQGFVFYLSVGFAITVVGSFFSGLMGLKEDDSDSYAGAIMLGVMWPLVPFLLLAGSVPFTLYLGRKTGEKLDEKAKALAEKKRADRVNQQLREQHPDAIGALSEATPNETGRLSEVTRSTNVPEDSSHFKGKGRNKIRS